MSWKGKVSVLSSQTEYKDQSAIYFIWNIHFIHVLTPLYHVHVIIKTAYSINHNYNKILESDWFLARPIFYQIGARTA